MIDEQFETDVGILADVEKAKRLIKQEVPLSPYWLTLIDDQGTLRTIKYDPYKEKK